MKKIILISSIVSLSLFSLAGSETQINRRLDDLRQVRMNLSRMTEQLRREGHPVAHRMAQQIEMMKDAEMSIRYLVNNDDNNDHHPIPPPPPPAPSSHFCSAACTTASGAPDLRYSGGDRAEFEVEAKQKALSGVQSKYSCTWGAKIVACSPEVARAKHSCSAACTTASGTPDLRFLRVDSASSFVEASLKARVAAQSAYSCTWGVADYKCSSNGDRVPTFCTAACTTDAGAVDMRYSAGSRGENLVEAEGLALMEAQKKYSCTWGVKISECSSN